MNPPMPQVQIAQSMRQMKDNLPALLELQEIESKLLRRKFLSLLREGFTDAQALELIKK